MSTRRNWNRDRERRQSRLAGTERPSYLPGMMAPLLRGRRHRPPQPSKADLRAQAELAMAEYAGEVVRLPTVVRVRCGTCGHRGEVHVPPGGTPPRFRCTKCGTADGPARADV
jgi:hypothetical protein